jgi:nicotinamidase-related amidase
MSVSADAQALVVVDMQRAFLVGDHAVPDADRLRAAVTRQLENARAAGCLVVHLRNDGAPGTPDAPGTAGWHLVSDVSPGERVLSKTTDDGFVGTALETLLRSAEVSTLSICGVMSEMCVAETARGALQRGFAVVLARDAHATYPVPEQGPSAPAVAACLVSRVAEWSLGDEPVLVDGSTEVRFTAP